MKARRRKFKIEHKALRPYLKLNCIAFKLIQYRDWILNLFYRLITQFILYKIIKFSNETPNYPNKNSNKLLKNNNKIFKEINYVIIFHRNHDPMMFLGIYGCKIMLSHTNTI